MIEHKIIPPLSIEWWSYNLITLAVIIFILITGRKMVSEKNKNILTISIASVFIFECIFMDIYHLTTGLWSLKDSLPLHLCGLMWLLSIYVFLTKKQWGFEMLLFIGMAGGIHSLLTPELTHGDNLLHKIDFFVGHGGLLLAPLYAILVLNMWPRKNAWWKSFLQLQPIVLIVFLINTILNSNYMYLSAPPIANNPLIPPSDMLLGQWPYYILIFEICVLLHCGLINIPFWFKNNYDQ
tara:strand:+ start:52 stop:765 length:714 start_codon:yes stop_codon:yes gene_type:complete